MMGRWGLNGMQSFEQKSVAKKEGDRLPSAGVADSTETAFASSA